MTAQQIIDKLVKDGNSGKTSLNDEGMKYVKQADTFPPQSHMDAMGLKRNDPLCAFADRLIWGCLDGRPRRRMTDQNWQYKFLYELRSGHLRNILATQRQIPVIYSRAITFILQQRSEGRGWKRRGESSAWDRIWGLLNAL